MKKIIIMMTLLFSFNSMAFSEGFLLGMAVGDDSSEVNKLEKEVESLKQKNQELRMLLKIHKKRADRCRNSNSNKKKNIK